MDETTTQRANGSSRSAIPDVPSAVAHGLPGERDRHALWLSQAQQVRAQEWFNFASDGFVLTDLWGVIEEANYAAAELLDARKEFLLDKPLGLFLLPESRSAFYSRLRRLAARRGVEQWEARVGRPAGQPRDLRLTATAYLGEHGQGDKLRWLLHDVSAARRAERAWLAEKGLADCLVDAAEVLILLVSERGRILRSNPHVWMVSGYAADDLHGRIWQQLLLPAEEQEAGRELLEQAAKEGTGKSGPVEFVTQPGERRRVLWAARKLDGNLLLIGHDVTELHEAQQLALRAERLAAIGQISAGLAHESRNALQRGQACVALLALRLKDQPEYLELLGRIEKAQDDLQRLFEDVRVYAAPRLQPQWCNLAECWREAWNNLSNHPHWPDADFREELDETDLFCQVDPFYLQQVFRNLLENSLASACSPLRLVLRARPASLHGNEAVCVRLRDNGMGIPPEVRPRLFEPFFTTKVRGTGLGLAICRRIVEAHGGTIHAEEDSGSGTEMVITLPRRGS